MTESALYAEHRGYLTARGVADDVIAERKVFSVPTKSALQVLGFGRNTPAPAMVMPLWDVAGGCDGYQIRPDQPRAGAGGRLLKFEVPHRFTPRLDVHPRSFPLLADPTVPLWVTEGVPKGDALVSAGQAAVVLLGVWNWTGDSLADFEYLRAKGRRIYVCFDSDVMLKESVHAALGRLGALLAHRGADVAYVYLPDDAQGRKQGVDDYLAAGGTVAELLAAHTTTELRRPAWEQPAPKADTFDDVPDEDGWALLDDLAAFIDRFVAWTPAKRDAVALWTLHSHAIDAFGTTPRLNVRSAEKQSGKTRLLELLNLLTRQARFTVSMSAPYMFRAIEAHCPTLLVDETDAIFGAKTEQNHEDLRALINAGHRRGATVGRMAGEGAGMVPTEFACFCPVALAGIGRLPDTVHDRSIVIELRRRAPGETVDAYRERRVRPVAEKLARRAAAWAARHRDELVEADPVMPDGITDRPADVWEPLLAIADAAGGDWPHAARAACLDLNAVRADDDASLGVQLLDDIHGVFDRAGDDKVSTATLLETLAGIEEAPWGDWYGKPITSRWLAGKLKPYGIHSKQVRIGDTTLKGYDRADFEDAWTR